MTSEALLLALCWYVAWALCRCWIVANKQEQEQEPEEIPPMTAGEVAEFRRHREIIRRLDPALALRLDTLHPVPPCPEHRGAREDYRAGSFRQCYPCGGTGRQGRPKCEECDGRGIIPNEWKCKFCGVLLHRAGNHWYEGAPVRISLNDLQDPIIIKPRPRRARTQSFGPR